MRFRGLTLIELLLATAITAMVGAAIVAMLGAVNTGVGSRRDTRAVLARAAAARSRVSSYIAPARCLLDVNGSALTVWFDDSRKSDTVHASEIRWLRRDGAASTLYVYFVHFPSNWSQAACDLADLEYPAASHWDDVLTSYQAQGLIARLPLIDGLGSMSIITDQPTAMNVKHLSLECGFTTTDGSQPVSIPATINSHAVPKS